MKALLLCLAAVSVFAQESFDLVIANGSLVDGTGGPARSADVGIRAGKFAAIGDLSKSQRRRTIDAKGLTVAPGFIDMHNHSDDTLLDEPRCESMIRQGVTTMVLGEGGSAGPVKPGRQPWTTLGGYFDHVEKKGVSANVCSYVGQTQIWTHVKGFDLKGASPADMEAMKKEVAIAMEDGAMGLATSLLMPPSSLITTAQLIELAKVASSYGGIYSTHTRDEGAGVFRSIDEAIQVGKGAKIRVDCIHLKVADKQFWGQMPEIIAMIRKAREQGADIQAHVYPYTAGQNNLRAIIPPWAHDGGNAKMLERLKDPAMRTRMRKDIENGLPEWYNHYLAVGKDWNAMLLVAPRNPKNQPFTGKRMGELIKARGGDPIDVLFDVLIEENGSVGTVYFHHSEQDMQFAMKQPFTSIGSDGSAMSPEGKRGASRPHPRSYGTFPRVLGRYVRELKVISLPEAVKKMSSMNAAKINIPDRGTVKVGNWADVAIFDPATVADKADYVNPHQYAVGIPYVVVNGEVVLDNGRHTNAMPGKVLRGPGYKKR
jgi:N-acyl-D-amino-acid deacylase